MLYCIAGKFGEFFIWRFGKFGKIESPPVEHNYTRTPMTVRIQISPIDSHFTKFNAYQSYPAV